MHLVSTDWFWECLFPRTTLKIGAIFKKKKKNHNILLGLCKSGLFRCVLGETGSTGPDGELRQKSPAACVQQTRRKKQEMESVTPVSSACDKTKLLDVKEQGGKQNTRKETAPQKESLIESFSLI